MTEKLARFGWGHGRGRFSRRINLMMGCVIMLVGLGLPTRLTLPSLSRDALAGDRDIPQLPVEPVFEEVQVLSPSIHKMLAELLQDQERVAGEPVMIASFRNHAGYSVEDFSSKILSEWRKNRGGKATGVLIAWYDQENEVHIQTGFGLEGILEAEKTNTIAEDFFRNEWKAGSPDRAFALSVLEILKELKSPVIQTLQSLQTLENLESRKDQSTGPQATSTLLERFRAAGLQGDLSPTELSSSIWALWFFLIIALGLGTYVMMHVFSAEAHYTSEGWFRVPARMSIQIGWAPWQKRIFSPGSGQRKSPKAAQETGGTIGTW